MSETSDTNSNWERTKGGIKKGWKSVKEGVGKGAGYVYDRGKPVIIKTSRFFKNQALMSLVTATHVGAEGMLATYDTIMAYSVDHRPNVLYMNADEIMMSGPLTQRLDEFEGYRDRLKQAKKQVVEDGRPSRSNTNPKRRMPSYTESSVLPGYGVFQTLGSDSLQRVVDSSDTLADTMPHFTLKIVNNPPVGTAKGPLELEFTIKYFEKGAKTFGDTLTQSKIAFSIGDSALRFDTNGQLKVGSEWIINDKKYPAMFMSATNIARIIQASILEKTNQVATISYRTINAIIDVLMQVNKGGTENENRMLTRVFERWNKIHFLEHVTVMEPGKIIMAIAMSFDIYDAEGEKYSDADASEKFSKILEDILPLIDDAQEYGGLYVKLIELFHTKMKDSKGVLTVKPSNQLNMGTVKLIVEQSAQSDALRGLMLAYTPAGDPTDLDPSKITSASSQLSSVLASDLGIEMLMVMIEYLTISEKAQLHAGRNAAKMAASAAQMAIEMSNAETEFVMQGHRDATEAGISELHSIPEAAVTAVTQAVRDNIRRRHNGSSAGDSNVES